MAPLAPFAPFAPLAFPSLPPCPSISRPPTPPRPHSARPAASLRRRAACCVLSELTDSMDSTVLTRNRQSPLRSRPGLVILTYCQPLWRFGPAAARATVSPFCAMLAVARRIFAQCKSFLPSCMPDMVPGMVPGMPPWFFTAAPIPRRQGASAQAHAKTRLGLITRRLDLGPDPHVCHPRNADLEAEPWQRPRRHQILRRVAASVCVLPAFSLPSLHYLRLKEVPGSDRQV